MTIIEGLAIATQTVAEMREADLFSVSVTNDEIRLHITWEAFQRMFGGCDVEVCDGHVQFVLGGVTYAAMMRREPTHGTIKCPVAT